MYKQKIQVKEIRSNLRELPILRSNFEIISIFILRLFGFPVTSAAFIWIETDNRRSDQAFDICVSRQESACTELFPSSVFSDIHHSISSQLWATVADWFTLEIFLLSFSSQRTMGLHFTPHSLVNCTPFTSIQIFGNFLHLVLAWIVGGEQKNSFFQSSLHTSV